MTFAAPAWGAAGAFPTTGPATMDVNARGPWRIDGPGLRDLKPAPDDLRRLVATLPEFGGGTTLIRFCPAAIADLSRRWPLDLAEPLTRLWRAGFAGAWFWSLNAGDEYEFRGKPAEAFRCWVETHGQ